MGRQPVERPGSTGQHRGFAGGVHGEGGAPAPPPLSFPSKFTLRAPGGASPCDAKSISIWPVLLQDGEGERTRKSTNTATMTKSACECGEGEAYVLGVAEDGGRRQEARGAEEESMGETLKGVGERERRSAQVGGGARQALSRPGDEASRLSAQTLFWRCAD